ncbi:MAG: DUF4124 domain-containing protein [Pseudomonadota bacterium]
MTLLPKPAWPSALLMAALYLLMLPTPQAGEIQRWTDAQGNVHFGDRPPADVAAETVRLRVNTYAAPDIEGLQGVFDNGDQVVMYSAAWCGVCKKAKRYFEAEHIPFTEYDVETSARGQRDFKRLGGRGVPIILIGAQRLNGFTPASFERIYRR